METRTIVNAITIGAICVFAYLFTDKMATQATKASERRLTLESEKDRIQIAGFLGGVTYVEDPRTGGCFARYRAAGYRYLTAVPCDGIPTNMLVIPDMGITNNIAK